MRIRPTELDAIVAGTLDLAFRRWERPRLLVGTRMRTRVGLVEVTSLSEVDPATLTEDDARRAGAPSLAALQRGLADDDRPAFRVGLRFAGEDPRAVLRRTPPTPAEVADLQARLDRLDRASSVGPWTAQALQLVDAHPERRAPELAALAGRPTAEFKRDVRKLKELGLTESLDIGYRLSARGAAVVDAARRAAGGRARRRKPAPEGTPLPSIGAPATRALRAAGLTSLEAVAGSTDAELLAMHGVGPIAVARLRAALGSGQPDSRAQSEGPSSTG